MKANPKGAAGEEYAAQQLEKNGYNIIGRNYHSRFGEIDIIAVKDGIIAFVEVKARKTGSLVSGPESVTAHKRRRIILTARAYMAGKDLSMQPRFDIFSVITQGGGVISHDHMEGAFDCDG